MHSNSNSDVLIVPNNITHSKSNLVDAFSVRWELGLTDLVDEVSSLRTNRYASSTCKYELIAHEILNFETFINIIVERQRQRWTEPERAEVQKSRV